MSEKKARKYRCKCVICHTDVITYIENFCAYEFVSVNVYVQMWIHKKKDEKEIQREKSKKYYQTKRQAWQNCKKNVMPATLCVRCVLGKQVMRIVWCYCCLGVVENKIKLTITAAATTATAITKNFEESQSNLLHFVRSLSSFFPLDAVWCWLWFEMSQTFSISNW